MRRATLSIRFSPFSSVHIRVHLPIRAFTMFLLRAWRSTAFGVYGLLNFTKSGFMENSKNFKPEDMEIPMKGKNCIVTGANSGIGYATAQGLASRGATVYMVCRDKVRGEAALSQIQSVTGNQDVHLELCDLSSISEVKSFASKFSSNNVPVHVLVNNAGLLSNERVKTPEGFELNFAVNVLGTYAITELMLPLLEKAAPDARVITVSSGGMYTVPLMKDLQFSERCFDGTTQYARNKRVQFLALTWCPSIITLGFTGFQTETNAEGNVTCNIKIIEVALTEKWAETYESKGIGFYSMHPGWADTPGVAKALPGFSKAFSGKIRTSEEGADTVVWLALQPNEKLVSGAFYFDRAEAPKHLTFAATSSSHAEIDSIVDSLHSLSAISS